MTILLQQAFEAARALPPDQQDDIARMVLNIAGEDGPEPIDAAHLSDILESIEQARKEEFASDDAVRSAFARLG